MGRSPRLVTAMRDVARPLLASMGSFLRKYSPGIIVWNYSFPSSARRGMCLLFCSTLNLGGEFATIIIFLSESVHERLPVLCHQETFLRLEFRKSSQELLPSR